MKLREALDHGALICRAAMTRMRELLVDLRAREEGPQDLHGAFEALAGPLRELGVEVIIGIGVDQPLKADTALLMHRAAREILLAVRAHPDTTLVTVGLIERAGEVVLTIDHNSVRTGPAADPAPAPPGSLELLADRLAAAGGSLAVDRTPDRGVHYTAAMPAA